MSDEHKVGINAFFFNVFEHDGELFLATGWLLDQEAVEARARTRQQVPWSGCWYVNVGEGEHRCWADMRRYGFLAAGGNPVYSDPMQKLSAGDQVFAHQKQTGYVGYGIVTREYTPAREFMANETPLFDLDLQQPGIRSNARDPEKEEYCVGVEWRHTAPLAEAKTFSGIFANQNVVCKLRHAETLEFLKQHLVEPATKAD